MIRIIRKNHSRIWLLALWLTLAVLLGVNQAHAACSIDSSGTYIDAENYTASTVITGNNNVGFTKKNDASANGSSVMETGKVKNNATYFSTLSYTINVSTAGTYYLWFLGTGQSFAVTVDGSTASTVAFANGGGPGSTSYSWSSSAITVSLSAGEHTITVTASNQGTGVDGLYISNSATAPTDTTASTAANLDPNSCDAGEITVSPDLISATCYVGNNADSGTFTITNSGTSALTNIAVATSASWLSASPETISTLAVGDSVTITVSFATSSLSTGTSSTDIEITADNSTNSATVTASVLVKETSDDVACGDVPLYAQDIVTPAIMVQLDTSGSMASAVYALSNGENPETPDLSDIVQEIVGMSGWTSGNSMAFVITGTGSRTAYSYDGLSYAAPTLTIKYTESSTTEEVTSRVSASAGDVQVNGTTVNTTAVSLALGNSKPVGLLFKDITVPAGATIVSAEIEFIIKATGGSSTTNLTVYGVKAANPTSLTYADIATSSNYTSASVAWSSVESWASTLTRIAIAEDVLAEVFEDDSISWGFATWTSKHSTSTYPNYTYYRIGVHEADAAHQATLQEIVDDGTADGNTPLLYTMQAALDYFGGSRKDAYYGEAYEDVECQPKILLLVTDGIGNLPSSATISDFKTKAQALADAGVSVVCVGFGLSDASQLQAIVDIAQKNGETSDSDYLYALHGTDSDGNPVPYLAQSRADFIEAMQTIVSAVKNQAFLGSGPAATTSSDGDDYVLYSSFDPSDNWSGDLTMYNYDSSTGAVDSTPVWTAQEAMPDDINAFIYDSTATNLVSEYTDASLTGDDYLCKPLGDIINSSPVVLSTPKKSYSFNSYKSWKYSSEVYERTPLVYVNANDGALHAFRLEDGVEEWRFYPDSVKTKLNLASSDSQYDMCSSSYCHLYLNDGTPVIEDVYNGSEWETILTSGLGLGGQAYFALDVSYGNDFDDDTLPAKYLWEFTNTDDEEIGMGTSLPEVARVELYENSGSSWSSSGTSWVTYMGSGEASTDTLQASKEAYLFAVRSWDKAMVWRTDTNSTKADTYKVKLESGTLKDDVAASPTHVNVEGNDYVYDRIYLGNRYGDMFRVSDIGEGQIPVVDKLFDSANTDHSTPIVAKAGYAYDGDSDGDSIYNVWLYFGTGIYEETADQLTTDQQYLFGLLDEEGAKSSPYEMSDLVTMKTEIVEGYTYDSSGNKVDVDGNGIVNADDIRPYRTLSCDAAYQDSDGYCTSNGASWVVELATPDDTASERSFRKPLVYQGVVYFVTFIPNGQECEGNGISYVIALDYQNGSGTDTPVFDINGDGSYTTEDTYIVDASGNKHQVVGLSLGTGVASELTLSTSGEGATIHYSMSGSNYTTGSSSSSSGSTSSSSSEGTAATDTNMSEGTSSMGGAGGGGINDDFDKVQLKGWWQTTN